MSMFVKFVGTIDHFFHFLKVQLVTSLKIITIKKKFKIFSLSCLDPSIKWKCRSNPWEEVSVFNGLRMDIIKVISFYVHWIGSSWLHIFKLLSYLESSYQEMCVLSCLLLHWFNQDISLKWKTKNSLAHHTRLFKLLHWLAELVST